MPIIANFVKNCANFVKTLFLLVFSIRTKLNIKRKALLFAKERLFTVIKS